jgi:hypothetical protein
MCTVPTLILNCGVGISGIYAGSIKEAKAEKTQISSNYSGCVLHDILMVILHTF